MKIKPIKLEYGRRQTKHGSYSLALSAIVIAAAVILNLIVSELPSKYTQIDVSDQKLSVLGEQSEEVLRALSKDMTIYYLAQEGNRDETVSRLLRRYEDGSGHITVEEKDPVRYPQFASQYTSETLPENSVIIVCGEQSRVISYNDMYESEFNYSYYTYETTGFDAEGQITSAIAALDSDALPKVYTLTGHNEITLDGALQDAVTKENIETQELNLISAAAVPEDADALLIASPRQDLSDAETRKVLNYLRRGGHAVIVTDYTGTDMPNLDSVLEYYGMTRAEGVVFETDANNFVQMPYYLLPTINSTDVSGNMTGANAYVLMAAAQGIQISEDLRDGLTVTDVLSTSASSYSKTDVQNMTTYEKEDGDLDGPFSVGAIASENVELTEELLAETAEDAAADTLETPLELNVEQTTEAESAEEEQATEAESAEEEQTTETKGDGEEQTTEAKSAEEEQAAEAESAETRLAFFTTASLLDASADQMVSGGNYQLLMNTMSWLCGNENSVSIPSKSLSTDYLTVPAGSASFWSIIAIGVIPGAFLITGLYVWLKRRKQ